MDGSGVLWCPAVVLWCPAAFRLTVDQRFTQITIGLIENKLKVTNYKNRKIILCKIRPEHSRHLFLLFVCLLKKKGF